MEKIIKRGKAYTQMLKKQSGLETEVQLTVRERGLRVRIIRRSLKLRHRLVRRYNCTAYIGIKKETQEEGGRTNEIRAVYLGEGKSLTLSDA